MIRNQFWRAISGAALVSLCACGSVATDSLFSSVGVGGSSSSEGGAAQAGSGSELAGAGQAPGGSAGVGGSSGSVNSVAGSVGVGGSSAHGGANAGGSSNAGGASLGGAAGVGGGPPAPSACDGKIAKAKAFIDNFEAGVVNNWFGYVDAGPAPVTVTSPGALETLQAARFAIGHASQSGMGHGMSCTDVSAFDGISFWAKSATGGSIRFLAAIPATDPTPGVGDCKIKCYDHPGKLFSNVGGEWQHYSAAWSELQQYGFGSKASFNKVINTLLWINEGEVSNADFSIDEVVLYKGEPPTGKAGN